MGVVQCRGGHLAVGVLPGDDGHGVGRGQPGVDEEEDEVLLVVGPDAVVHPGAVVVHPHYAPPADPTVVAPAEKHNLNQGWVTRQPRHKQQYKRAYLGGL